MPRSDTLDSSVAQLSNARGDGPGSPEHDFPASSAPGSAALEELGRRIRKLRVEKRMTLKEVEKCSGLSATHLSEIERGRTSPTIGALIRIARSLEREPSYFIEPDERPDVAHGRREETQSTSFTGGLTVESLTRGIPGSEICAYRLRFPSTASAELVLKAQGTSGDALFFLTHGSLDVSIGENPVRLAAGDAFQAPLTVALRLVAQPGETAEVIALLTMPLEEIV